jgi:hypothetical protein
MKMVAESDRASRNLLKRAKTPRHAKIAKVNSYWRSLRLLAALRELAISIQAPRLIPKI